MRKLQLQRALVSACLAISFGCGTSVSNDPSGGDPNTPKPGDLRIEPADAFLEISTGVAATQDFKVFELQKSGDEKDVTDKAVFQLTAGYLGQMNGAVFTTNERAGRTLLSAYVGTASADAEIAVKLNHVIVEPGVPSDAPDRFAGATPGGAAPSIVYPGAGVMLPPNLSELEFHYLPGASNELFELDFSGDLIGLKIYAQCDPLAEGCLYLPSEETWQLLAESARGNSLFLTLRGLTGTTVGASEASTMSFAQNDLYGGIYYWDAAGAIMRYDFGRRDQTAETYLNAPEAGGTTCVGCHAMSRDGTKIAVGVDMPSPAPMRAFEVDAKQMAWSDDDGANFYAFSPDNSQMLTSNGNSIDLRNAVTGEKIGTEPIIALGSMPDWAADGTKITYSKPGTSVCGDGGGGGIPGLPGFPGLPGGDGGIDTCATVGHGTGSIMLMDAGSWSNEKTLVRADGRNNYYPAFTPDSNWVIFNRSPLNKDSYDTDDAELWAVSTAGSKPEIRLDSATTGITDSWPKVSPYVHQFENRDIYWFTFSSKRNFGLRLKNEDMSYNDDDDPRTAQIWMAAFDPSKAADGHDPTWVAFRLPFQDISTGNHIAQWVEQINSSPCVEDEECPFGEFCSEGWCQPVPVYE